MARIVIPRVVTDHMGGAEIYASCYFMRNSPDIRARAIEDAEFLLGVNFSGYEDYPQPETLNAVKKFLLKSKPFA